MIHHNGMSGKRMLQLAAVGVLMWIGLVALGMWIVR